MAIEQPFQVLFETFGRLPATHAEPVNRAAYGKLRDLLSVGLEHPGRCILLRAPRAGHGKTHLLTRLQHELSGGHEFIPLHPIHGTRIDAGTVIADTLSRLSRPLPASGGLCVLDLVTRRLFALALQPLVRSGEVPCQDREGALGALRDRPVETFDFHHPNAVTAHWARENFEVLGPRLALELSQRANSPLRDVAHWVNVLFRFASASPEQASRAGHLIEGAFSGDDAGQGDRLAALLALLTQLVRVVLVADDLEGFSSDETAALRLASFLGSLRHSAERVDALISVNSDIWESAFLPRMSGGLSDRLAEIVVELQPLGHDEILALLETRLPGYGDTVLSRLGADVPRHARGVLRSAGIAWDRAVADQEASRFTAAPVAAETPAFAPEPAAVLPDPVIPPPPVAAAPTEMFQSAPPAEIAAAPIAPTTFAAPVSVDEEAPVASVPVLQPEPVDVPPQGISQSVAAASPFVSLVEEEAPVPVLTPGASEVKVSPHSPVYGQASPFSAAPGEAPAQPASGSEPERVDELLRQFRERYAKG